MLAVESLPWNSLKLTDSQIPWSGLHELADAATADQQVRARLIEELDAHMGRLGAGEGGSRAEIVDLGVPAVFALAAERLSEEGRKQAAGGLLRALYRAR